MRQLLVTWPPPIKIGGKWRPGGKGPHSDVEVRVAYSLFHTPTLCELLAGVEVSELRVSRLKDQWRLMVKGTRKEKPLVAYFYAKSWRDVFTVMATHMDTGRASWGHDAWPPNTR